MVALGLIGYAQNYYFHLRKLVPRMVDIHSSNNMQDTTRTMLIKDGWRR
jgi:hypothetical protein